MRLSFILLASFCTIAHADHRRYSRTPALHLDVHAPARVHPKPPPARPAQPAVSADDLLEIEDRNQPIRVEQERDLEGLVRDTPDDDPQKPDLMLRLAEHYARQLRFWKLKAIEATVSRP